MVGHSVFDRLSTTKLSFRYYEIHPTCIDTNLSTWQCCHSCISIITIGMNKMSETNRKPFNHRSATFVRQIYIEGLLSDNAPVQSLRQWRMMTIHWDMKCLMRHMFMFTCRIGCTSNWSWLMHHKIWINNSKRSSIRWPKSINSNVLVKSKRSFIVAVFLVVVVLI